MRQLTFFILLFFCLPTKSLAQVDSLFRGTIQGYIIPFVWVDNNPRLRVGLEYHGYDRMAYSLEIGFGNNFLNQGKLNRVVWGQEYSFFELRPEIKWFVKENVKLPWYLRGAILVPNYFAVEGFYQEMHDQLENSDFDPKSSDIEIAYDEASFKKIKIGAHAKVGFKMLLWKKVVIDIYEGIGLAYRKISYTNLVNPVLTEDRNGEWWSESYKNEGAYFLFQVSLGVRVGYVFGKV